MLAKFYSALLAVLMTAFRIMRLHKMMIGISKLIYYFNEVHCIYVKYTKLVLYV